MDKEQAKKEITKLLTEYKEVVSLKKEKKYSEADTEKQFILPLFSALGWDIVRRDEVSS